MRHVKKLFYFWGSILLAFAVTQNAAADKFKTEKERLSYAVGMQIGNSLKQQGFTDIDTNALSAAINDVISGAKPQVSMEEMQAAVQSFQQKKMAERQTEAKCQQGSRR